MPARIQQKVLLLSQGKQSAIATLYAGSPGYLQFTQLNSDLATPNFQTESNAPEIGKGHEFATQQFATVFDPAASLDKYGSVEWSTWAWAFALGGVTVAGGSPPYTYTIVPINPATTIELPYFTIAEQLAEGGGSAADYAYVGCALEEVMSVIKYGAGRATHKCTASWIGSGNVTMPSGIAAPGVTTELNMLSGSAAITINGTNYVTAASSGRILQVQMGWKNNLNKGAGFRPGSGTQSLDSGLAAQVRDWIPIGTRVPTFEFDALLQHNSPEFNALVNQTQGTAVIGMTYDSNDKITWTWEQLSYKVIQNKAEEGLVAVHVTADPMYNSSNGVLSITSKCVLPSVCQ
jgi:hypothetical protein